MLIIRIRFPNGRGGGPGTGRVASGLLANA